MQGTRTNVTAGGAVPQFIGLQQIQLGGVWVELG